MLKVFLVEDETVIREGLRDHIPWDQYGYRFVGEASDGEMALPLIRKTRPDLIITDIKMPYMDAILSLFLISYIILILVRAVFTKRFPLANGQPIG